MSTPDDFRLPDLPPEKSLEKSKKRLHRKLVRSIARNVFDLEISGLIDQFDHADLSIKLEEHYVPDTEESPDEKKYDEWEYDDDDFRGTPVFSIETRYTTQVPTYMNDLIRVHQAIVECEVDPCLTAETIATLQEGHRLILADFLVARYVEKERPHLADEDEEENEGDMLDYEDRIALLQKEKDIQALAQTHRAIIAGTFNIATDKSEFYKTDILSKRFPREIPLSNRSEKKRKRRKK